MAATFCASTVGVGVGDGVATMDGVKVSVGCATHALLNTSTTAVMAAGSNRRAQAGRPFMGVVTRANLTKNGRRGMVKS